MQITDDDISQILKIIDSSNLAEVRVETADFTLHVVRGGEGELVHRSSVAPGSSADGTATAAYADSSPATPAVPAPKAETSRDAPLELREGWEVIRSPMLGTFYRAPKPGAPPFVEIGDMVEPDDTLCLIEVMKLFNSIKAGVAGRVVAIHAENASLIEYDQPLIVVDTTA